MEKTENKISIKQEIRTLSLLGANGSFGVSMCELAKENKNIVCLTADLRNFSGLKRFSEEFQEQFYNVGICEQNMIGVASGLTKENYIPFASSYATFISARCLDQIRFNLGYMQRNVKLVGLTSGLALGLFGGTHIALEDISLIRAIPNIVILSPCDCFEIKKALIASSKINAPCYIRLFGGNNCPIIYKQDYDFEIGKAICLKEGRDIAIIATGSMVHKALNIADKLDEININTKVINMHTIKPLDISAITKELNKKLIVTIEEHSIYGGLGSCVSEVLSALDKKPKHLIIGMDDEFKSACEYECMLEKYKLDEKNIFEKILKALGRK